MAVPSKADHPDHAAVLDAFGFPSSSPAVYPTGKVHPVVSPPPPPPPKRVDIPGGPRCQGPREGARRRRFWGDGLKTYRRLRSAMQSPEKAIRAPRQQRPRWYLFVLGSVRLPATMDMSEIRNRQQRRETPAAGPDGNAQRGAWKVLRSLSCTGLDTAAAVTSPSGLPAHVQDA
ncbi:hypothetical protein Cni_G26164 [Canna indica]|uniref:Uncharacterized protein n=1 Tax=Canna indica TaxID=4628 RepID=A0AAQ3L5K6_9LILI|nr:hypothetical protein Cni_G26164 [Canna indica]